MLRGRLSIDGAFLLTDDVGSATESDWAESLSTGAVSSTTGISHRTHDVGSWRTR